MRSFGLATALLCVLARADGAQIMGGPRAPDVSWTQRMGNALPLDTELVDHEGRTVTLGQCLHGRPVVLALVYYECPMLCDLVFEGLVKALRALELEPGRDYDVVAVSIDPGESAALARAKRASCLERYGLAPDDARAAGWTFLVGAEPAVRAVADAVGFGYQYVPERDEWAHPAGVTVLTPAGTVARVLFGVEFAPRDLRFALVEASAGRVGSPIDQVLLRCFHYDPSTGRYGLAVLTLVRGLGALTVALLSFFVLRGLWRERRARAVPAGSGG